MSNITYININDQEVRYMILDGREFYCLKDIAKVTMLKNIFTSMNNVTQSEKELVKVKTTGGSQMMLFISKIAVKIILSKSRKVIAKTVADAFNIELINTHAMTKEQSTIKNIMKAFRNEEMIQQYTVGKYKIDFYFPQYKLAIECDEQFHEKNIEYDSKRQKEIETMLVQGLKNPLSYDIINFNV